MTLNPSASVVEVSDNQTGTWVWRWCFCQTPTCFLKSCFFLQFCQPQEIDRSQPGVHLSLSSFQARFIGSYFAILSGYFWLSSLPSPSPLSFKETSNFNLEKTFNFECWLSVSIWIFNTLHSMTIFIFIEWIRRTSKEVLLLYFFLLVLFSKLVESVFT